jgi:hypothetical protein
MFKCPPARESGQLASTQAICLAMRCNGGQKVKKVANNIGTRICIDGDGDERCEGIASEARVYPGQSWSAE